MRSILMLVSLTAAMSQLVCAQHARPSPVQQWAPFATDTTTTHSDLDPIDHVAALRSPYTSNLATATSKVARSTATLIGAGVGFVVGGGATWAILHSGGSTAPCNRDANQDAMSAGECFGITVVGGAAGALLGALTARWLAVL